MVDIIGTRFVKPGQYGDFNWMLEQDKYLDSLFIFNDCEAHFLSASAQDVRVVNKELIFQVGGGNAVVRPWQTVGRVVGIPTGCYQVTDKCLVEGSETETYNVIKRQGYPELNMQVKTVVQAAMTRIALTVIERGYTRIFYSAEANGNIGTAIFKPDPAVVHYITAAIKCLPSTIAYHQNLEALL